MRTIKVQSEDLKSAMAYVAKIGNNASGITDYVVLNAEGGYLHLSSTNGQDWLSHRVCSSGDDIVKPIAVGMEWLKGICACEEGATITLEFDGGFVTARTIDAEIVGPYTSEEGTAEKYPNRKEAITDGQTIHMKHSQIAPALSAIDFALAKDEIRIVMTGVYVNLLDDKHAELASTDGRVMMAKTIRIEGLHTADTSVPYKGFILSPFAIKTIKGMAGELCISIKGNAVEIACGDSTCRTTSIEGKYPNYRSVLPKRESATSAKVSKDSLRLAIKRAATYQDTVIGLEVSKGKASLYTLNYEAGTSTIASIPALCEADEPIMVGLSSAMITKMLTNIKGENVILNVTSPQHPITIDGADETMIALIMPMCIDIDLRQGLVKATNKTTPVAPEEEPTEEPAEAPEEEPEEEPTEEPEEEPEEEPGGELEPTEEPAEEPTDDDEERSIEDEINELL